MQATISGTVTTSVDLGGAAYPSPLTVGGSGVILPSAVSAAGVLAVVADATLTNDGKISGGVGLAVEGGTGVDLLSGGDRLSNRGSIAGGTGRSTGKAGLGLNGGTGVAIASGEITNGGTIAGGQGGGYFNPIPAPSVGNGGTGVVLDSSSLVNAGSIAGGNAGAVGYLSGLDTFYLYYGAGGTGVNLADSASSVLNRGTITGGYDGGLGIDMRAGGSLLNHGTITGGANGGNAVVATNGVIANTGVIAGAAGHYGRGGVGIELRGGTLSNAGTIEGGHGGGTQYGYGKGGAGVDLGAGAVLFNSGTISGGHGGFQREEGLGADGGVGVSLDGGTLVDSGQIDGGGAYRGANHFPGEDLSGAAIHFGNQASTLIIEPKASFYGGVFADSAVDDSLVLAGVGGTLTGISREFVDFTTIAEENTANWSLTGTNTIGTATTLLAAGLLHVAGKLIDDGSIVVTKAGALTLDAAVTGHGAIQIDAGSSLVLNSSLDGPSLAFGPGRHGTLSLGAGVAVGSTISGFAKGDTIQFALHATSLSFAGGTLTLDSGYKVIDTLALDGSYEADDFHLTHGGSGADPVSDITYVGATLSAPAVLPDFAASILQTAAAETPAAIGGAALLDRFGWLDLDVPPPLHGISR
jgi:fibronectin-binding autotransporter adhesin